MKKIIKNILGVLIIACVCINGNVNGVLLSNAKQNSISIKVMEATEYGNKLKQAYEKEKKLEANNDVQNVCKSKKEEVSIKAYGKLKEKVCDDETSRYTSYYAGAYLDNKDDLVVQISKKNKKIVEDIQEITDLKEVPVNVVKYSYNKLQYVFNDISEKMEEKEEDIISNIVSVYISQKKNCVIVSMKDISKKKIAEFKRDVSCEECIKFEQVEELSASGNMYLGKKINISGGNYSIGCRAYAYKNGKIKYGFITAGHNTKVNDVVSYYLSDASKVKIGKVIGRKCSGSVDCAFVEVTKSNYKVSNHVKSSDGVAVKKYVASSYVEGETVCKSGYAGGTKKGKILSTSCTVTYSDIGVTLKKMYKANYQTKKGDSGGVIYHNSEKEFAGIQSGVQDNSLKKGYYNICFYVDQDYVFSNWGGLRDIFLY